MKALIYLLLCIILVSSVIALNCPESEKVCLEHGGTICTPYEDDDYKDCIIEKERLESECGTISGGTCGSRICSMPERCESECIKWGCQDDLIVTYGNNEEERIEDIPEEPVQAIESDSLVTLEDLSCEGCPQACEYIEDGGCGICNCPENLRRCVSTGLRDIINETNSYCFKGLLFEQKQDNQTCQNNFECISHFCSKGICYDISNKVEENSNILTKIWSWLSGLLG
ncbi:MAG: hypothetical protein K9N07_10360 [Candidatus Cloacimonetes bacterium]|nr:hypothetical protein [Candidatus Cloacimonadota bacterium]MCF8012742.1 hypothetical protein [Candidatus Woesearchaeota archaeon]